MTSSHLIAPTGGVLADRLPDTAAADQANRRAQELPEVVLSPKQTCDPEMIAIGAFSPLTGFVESPDFDSICRTMRLTAGVIRPTPITLAVPLRNEGAGDADAMRDAVAGVRASRDRRGAQRVATSEAGTST